MSATGTTHISHKMGGDFCTKKCQKWWHLFSQEAAAASEHQGPELLQYDYVLKSYLQYSATFSSTTFENVTKFSYPSAFLDELDNFKQKV